MGLLLPWRDLIHNDAILRNPPNLMLPQIYIPSWYYTEYRYKV